MRRVQGHRRRFQPHLDEFNREVKEGKPVMRRWMNGSADGDIYDTTAKVIEFIRLDYPVARAQEKIIEAKLRPQRATRLSTRT
jgi:hypothetical protein